MWGCEVTELLLVGAIFIAWALSKGDGNASPSEGLPTDEPPSDLPPSEPPESPPGPYAPPQSAGGLAGGEAPLPPVLTPGMAAKDVLAKYVSETPVPGSLYQVRQGDNPTGVAKKATGLNTGNPGITRYIEDTTAVLLNLNLYGKVVPKGTYGSIEVGDGQSYTIGTAFLPQNDAILAKLAQGIEPVPMAGAYTGAYGVLWLPPLSGGVEPPSEVKSLFPSIYGGS